MPIYREFSEQEINRFHRMIVKNILRIRKEQNVTQLELALAIGHKSVSTLGKIEAGLENKHYNLEHLYKISKILNVDICEFLKSEE